uniref:Ig-like domain-containing protein n=1 Tax=Anopheles quadriannulatus TaxID=34691 RepID=A0A182WYP2_ANOQN
MPYRWDAYALLLLALTVSWSALPPATGCPAEVCVCKWKGGKQTVECGGRFLNRLPDGMDPGTQVLNFSGNSLTILQSERFRKMELINLQKIYLARNQLVKIHDRAFRGLTNLVELDLSDNTLSEVPTETFQDYAALMRLSLSGNPIRALRASAFKQLSYLTTLELSNCQIELVEDEAFIGMDNLEWLRLDGNRIATIRGAHVLPESLHGINLQSNRWHCDCHLTDVYTWLNSFNVPQREEIKCSGPARLAGETVKTLTLDDLACLPVVTPETSYREIAEGRNISLDCRIVATPEPTVAWLFQGQVLLNDSFLSPNLHLYYFVDELDGAKHSELFIYNINADDNGTYSCVAENSAGRVQTNYTLHVIVKEEPVVEQVTFSEEYFLAIVAASAATAVLLALLCCIVACKCARARRASGSGAKKPRGAKGATADGLGGVPAGQQKCASITHDLGEPLTAGKLNGALGLGDGSNPQDIVLYLNANPNGLDKAALNNMTAMAQFCSPPSARSYQDQNPDLINDAESGQHKARPRPDAIDSDLGEKDSDEQSSVQDGGSEVSFQQQQQHQQQQQQQQGQGQGPYYPPMVLRGPRFASSALSTLPRGGTAALGGKDLSAYQHQVDIHLSPGCFLDQNGYPVDLSLMAAPSGPPVNYYRTLPHKKHQQQLQQQQQQPGGPGKPIARYANDAEFINRTQSPAAYQMYAPTDVRYTAEGYPQHEHGQFPSPPDGYKGEVHPVAYMSSAAAASAGFCVGPAPGPPQQWPTFLPGFHPQLIPIMAPAGGALLASPMMPSPSGQQQQQQLLSSPQTQPGSALKKCSVGAQTSELDKDVIPEQREEEEEEEDEQDGGGGGSTVKLRHLTGPLADSPDEGYVGDSHETSDI